MAISKPLVLIDSNITALGNVNMLVDTDLGVIAQAYRTDKVINAAANLIKTQRIMTERLMR